MGPRDPELPERQRRERDARRLRGTTEQPPDAEHGWFRTRAAFIGVAEPAIAKRARRGRLPLVEHIGARWYRRDHLGLAKPADLVQRPAARGPEMAPQGQYR